MPHRVRPTMVALFAVPLLANVALAGDFADSVLAYIPAPGQFISDARFNDPARALGPPLGGGTFSPPDLQKVVSLGGIGGSIVLRFSDPVRDDPCNPFGLDAIIYGNAIWVSNNPNRRFAEAGVIEISRDANGNGLADDAWYVIPGSHIASPAESQRETQLWDNNPSTPTPPSAANIAWYPTGFPPTYQTTTFGLPALFDVQILVNPNGLGALREGVWGYADCSPALLLGDTNADNIIDAPSLTPGEFYTSPDNPLAVGMSPGSGGGDAFDIAWALDPATGVPARLDGFDFIRISTGVNHIAGQFGDVSVEISAVADVRPREAFFDRTGDGIADIEDLYRWHELAASMENAADLDGDALITSRDRSMMQACIRSDEPAVLATDHLP